jgi:hypothetical protein
MLSEVLSQTLSEMLKSEKIEKTRKKSCLDGCRRSLDLLANAGPGQCAAAPRCLPVLRQVLK